MQLTINEELQIFNENQARAVHRNRVLLFLSRVRDVVFFGACVGFIFYVCFVYQG